MQQTRVREHSHGKTAGLAIGVTAGEAVVVFGGLFLALASQGVRDGWSGPTRAKTSAAAKTCWGCTPAGQLGSQLLILRAVTSGNAGRG